jgi:hypothetical protein
VVIGNEVKFAAFLCLLTELASEQRQLFGEETHTLWLLSLYQNIYYPNRSLYVPCPYSITLWLIYALYSQM